MARKTDIIGDAATMADDAPDFRQPVDDPQVDTSREYTIAHLPNDAPVTPLGHKKGNYFFLCNVGQLITLGSEFRKGEIYSLFGRRMQYLVDVFPQRGKASNDRPGPVVGFDQKRVQEALMNACHDRGIFDPTGRVRGRGAHRGPSGELYLHCGDHVMIAGERTRNENKVKPVRRVKPGQIGSLVFSTEPAIDPLDDTAAPVEVGAAISSLIGRWNWAHPQHGYLYFCWLPCALLGGALRNRPHIWVNGPSGAGKTTLQQATRDILGSWGLATEDATEAGLRQLINQDTLAVLFDEIEPDEGNAQVHTKIVKLARLAYSGGEALRGSVDHKSQVFQARSCFLFSSIHHHQLPAQDRNRMAIVELSKFPPNSELPKELTNSALLKVWGNQMRRRLAEQWHRFDETLSAYQTEMMTQGFSGREQDTYGTLLACGDLLLWDHAPSMLIDDNDIARVKGHVASLADILDKARSETEDTSQRCIGHLTSHRLPSARGDDQLSVGRWLAKAYIAIINKMERDPSANKLMQHGIKLVQRVPETGQSAGTAANMFDHNNPADHPIYVAIANNVNKSTGEIFESSMWRGGIWTQSLALLPGALIGRKTRFDGNTQGCVLVPLSECIDLEAAQRQAAQIID